MYLRIDTIERALAYCSLALTDPAEAGYGVALAVADDLLALNQRVIADAVNAVEEARVAWSDLAARHGTSCRFVEIICSDALEHRQRLDARGRGPSWEAVQAIQYAPFEWPALRLDTAGITPEHVERRLMDGLLNMGTP